MPNIPGDETNEPHQLWVSKRVVRWHIIFGILIWAVIEVKPWLAPQTYAILLQITFFTIAGADGIAAVIKLRPS